MYCEVVLRRSGGELFALRRRWRILLAGFFFILLVRKRNLLDTG
ncbi:hypothetical protein RUMHYD_01321 [Blautia hydrogenotrophica DSM 10507]|uniref:Uncharacterized protein n=1 Tax=Blautia hydrogenotrophica (strain DSM 10507 / JCM 14656 / S5a33) TaxID=476272 RepID=C0CKF1_BLAHS|nr:hypothetical protein RUMHYD_01321 [Blautia hydrogenotrophica DSM 10507]